MTLHDLRPEMWYSVRVTATNDAGSTDAEFTVRTVPNSHGELVTVVIFFDGGESNGV